MKLRIALIILSLFIIPVFLPAGDDEVKRASDKYGFLGPEIIKIGSNMQNLEPYDFDGDGNLDFFTAKPSDKKIFISYQEARAAAEPGLKFKTESFSIEKPFYFLCPGDIDNDGKADLAFLDNQNKLEILFHEKNKRDFEAPREINLDGIKGGILQISDLDNKGGNEIIIVDEENINIMSCDAQRAIQKSAKYENNCKKSVGLKIADLNGDGLKDIILINANSQTIAFRLQRGDNTFAPEITQKIEDLSYGDFADINNDRKDEIIGLHSQTNGVKIYNFLQPGEFKTIIKKKFQFSQLRDYQFKANTSSARSLDIGDVNNDGRNDIVIADKSRAEIELYLQGANGELTEKQTFPSFMDTCAVAIGDINSDRKNEVVILSTREKSIGAMAMTPENRLLFPKPIFPLELFPTTMLLANLNQDPKPEIIYGARDEKSEKGYIVIMKSDPKNNWVQSAKIDLSSKQGSVIEQIKSLDFNNDSLPDLMVFFEISSPAIFLQQKDGGFLDVTTENQSLKGLLDKLSPGQASYGNIDNNLGDELFICRNNFARSFSWQNNNQLEIIDQYNGKSSEANIQAALTADLNKDNIPEIILYDSTARQLSILQKKDNKPYEIVENIDVGYFAIKRIFLRDLNGDGADDLILFAQDHFGILYAGLADPQFEPLAGYITTIKRGVYTKYAVGNVNSDQIKDIAVIEGKRHNLEILSLDANNELKQELTFQIFEDPEVDLLDEEIDDYRWRNVPTAEPREIKIVDVNKDKKNDIVLLAHRNLLIYLQE